MPKSRYWISLYKIHSLHTGQVYALGKTTRFNKLFNTHQALLRAGEHWNGALQLAFDRGDDLWITEVEIVSSRDKDEVRGLLYQWHVELGIPWYGKEAL